MIARLAADLVVLLHLAFILFVVGGGVLALKWPRVAWLHLPCALWGVWIELSGRICPLTPLENRLRIAAGEDAYGGGFIERYVLPLIYPAELTRELQLALGLGVLGLNLVVYGLIVARRRRPRS